MMMMFSSIVFRSFPPIPNSLNVTSGQQETVRGKEKSTPNPSSLTSREKSLVRGTSSNHTLDCWNTQNGHKSFVKGSSTNYQNKPGIDSSCENERHRNHCIVEEIRQTNKIWFIHWFIHSFYIYDDKLSKRHEQGRVRTHQRQRQRDPSFREKQRKE